MTKRTHQEDQVRSGTAGKWIFRLVTFLIVICLCSAAAFVLVGRWQTAQLGALPEYDGISSSLNAGQRVYIGMTLASRKDELNSHIGSGSDITSFEISLGETAEQIASNLERAGILSDPDLFLNYLRYSGLDSYLEAGSFHIDPRLTYPELAERLAEATVVDVELRFIEGWRLEEMARYLEVVRPAEIDAADFLELVSNPDQIDLSAYAFLSSMPASATLEGFLFPDTYRVPIEAEAEDLIHLMLKNFDNRITPATRQAVGSQGLSIFEAVTLASVVQREAVISSESPAIAGVFLNRFRDGILLQADPTVQYPLGYDTASSSWWKSRLTLDDLQTNSPYNTYVIQGLPIGPISNPGLNSIEAVAAPDVTDFYYFVADCDPDAPGSHIFAQTYEEHLINVERCR